MKPLQKGERGNSPVVVVLLFIVIAAIGGSAFMYIEVSSAREAQMMAQTRAQAFKRQIRGIPALKEENRQANMILDDLGDLVGRVAPKVITPDGALAAVEWPEEEQVRFIHENDDGSYGRMRFTGKQEPHSHDKHDLTLILLSGRGRLHVGQKVIEIGRASPVFIPRGTEHLFDFSMSDVAVEAFVTISPRYTKDF